MSFKKRVGILAGLISVIVLVSLVLFPDWRTPVNFVVLVAVVAAAVAAFLADSKTWLADNPPAQAPTKVHASQGSVAIGGNNDGKVEVSHAGNFPPQNPEVPSHADISARNGSVAVGGNVGKEASIKVTHNHG